MEDDTPLTALTAATAFPEHIINETVYGQESFRTLQCTIKRVCDGTLSVRLSTPLIKWSQLSMHHNTCAPANWSAVWVTSKMKSGG